MIIRFSDFYKNALDEAVKVADAEKVAKLITSYLNRQLGNATLYPSIEQFKHGSDVYTTVQVIHNPDTIIRFNWLHGKLDTKALHSVTIFVKDQKNEVKFDKDVSLVQTLPHIVAVIKGGVRGGMFDFYFDDALAESEDELMNDELIESVEGLYEAQVDNPLSYVKNRVNQLSDGDKVPTSSFGAEGGSLAYALIRLLISSNPKCFDKNRLTNKAGLNWKQVEVKAAGAKVKTTVSRDNTKEDWVNPGLDEQEAEDQITYIEKIEDLSNMLKFMVKGATNAVFVAGRGGTGKTQTVEDTFEELGKTDGNGYFKVTGSASPAAIYETLYKNRKSIILFDDCDGALDTQDGRNLIKAATDTKQVRKVSWLKKGGSYFDPDEDGDQSDEDGIEDIGSQLPRYFEFIGKVVFISNLSMRKLDPDGALKTRGMMIEMNPTNMEMYEYMSMIYNKVKLSSGNTLSDAKRKEVVHTLREIVAKKQEYTVNLRLLVRALNLASTGLKDWERMLKYS